MTSYDKAYLLVGGNRSAHTDSAHSYSTHRNSAATASGVGYSQQQRFGFRDSRQGLGVGLGDTREGLHEGFGVRDHSDGHDQDPNPALPEFNLEMRVVSIPQVLHDSPQLHSSDSNPHATPLTACFAHPGTPNPRPPKPGGVRASGMVLGTLRRMLRSVLRGEQR